MDNLFAEVFKDYKKPEKDIVGRLSDLWGEYQHWAEGGDDPLTRKGVEAFNRFSGPGGMPLLQAGIKAAGVPAGKILGHASRNTWPGGYKAKPDIDKFFSGEGGMMWGPGLYTSENTKVTKSYLDSLSEGGTQFLLPSGKVKLDRSDFWERIKTEAAPKLAEGFALPNGDTLLPPWRTDNLTQQIATRISGAARRGFKDFSKQELVEDLYDTFKHDFNTIQQAKIAAGNGIGPKQVTNLFGDIIDDLVNQYKGTKARPDATMYQFLLKDKYLPDILDLNEQLRHQTPEVKAKLYRLSQGLNKELPPGTPMSLDYLRGNIDAAKAEYQYAMRNKPSGQSQQFEDMFKHSAEEPKFIGGNDYYGAWYNPKQDTVQLKVIGEHYKRGAPTKPDRRKSTLIAEEMSTDIENLFKKVSVQDPPFPFLSGRPGVDMFGRELGFSGEGFQNYLNHIYHNFPGVSKTDERLMASGIFDKYGIKGNRYFDEGSRTLDLDEFGMPKPQTKNYVLWSPEVLNDLPILKIRSLFDF